MSDKTHIQWTDATWNPVTGCTKVSQGCKHCYAERDWPRLSAPRPIANIYTGRAFTDVRCHPERLDEPLRWRRPRKVFVNSMSDLFHPDVPFEFIDDVFAAMALASRHTFQVLTKRPERMLEYMLRDPYFSVIDVIKHHPEALNIAWPLKNVWLGVSVEDDITADSRIPLLLQTPAVVRWISAEPLLDYVGLFGVVNPTSNKIDWVVCGGESGPKARPMHPDLARALRDQCQKSGIPFFFKQWGEWIPYEHDAQPPYLTSQHGDFFDAHWLPDFESGDGQSQREWLCDWSTNLLARRVGKKAAGRLLDGRTWDEYPYV